ncbi:N-acyl-phosphatidylethanolamine-hydrolyzing phospholipase D [Nematocida sp. AWRm78]|nr:N-acyl-phosphatidylethanolamine-hydrolyzing phospholipase D [Nematocida sp. AWRm79]KAI5183540.1 N-acyl-phosphatidylethanolamine-hydrolyzing phospholipase D [Nematocida sp. AWRm78]
MRKMKSVQIAIIVMVVYLLIIRGEDNFDKANNQAKNVHGLSVLEFESEIEKIAQNEYKNLAYTKYSFKTAGLKWKYAFFYPKKATWWFLSEKIYVYTESDSVLTKKVILCDKINVKKDLSDIKEKIEKKKKEISDFEKTFERPVIGKFIYGNPKSFDTWAPKFINPIELIKWQWNKITGKKPVFPTMEELKTEVPIKTPAFISDLEKYTKQVEKTAEVTWLGHACALVSIYGVNIITDPVFSPTASPMPVRMKAFLRHVDPPCKVEDLPEMHAVVISHTHYDHFDSKAIEGINKKSPNAVWYVPKGIDRLLKGHKVKNIVSMNWGECVKKDYKQADGNISTLTVTCVPSQHWSGRTPFDPFKDLWCGWVTSVSSNEKKFQSKSVFFAGDTGMCRKEFIKIGMWFNIDMGLIPIGCYEPSNFMHPQHISPKEALVIHDSIGAKKSMAIHWGTYDMGSSEDFLQPRQDLINNRSDLNIGEDKFVVVNPGESISF